MEASNPHIPGSEPWFEFEMTAALSRLGISSSFRDGVREIHEPIPTPALLEPSLAVVVESSAIVSVSEQASILSPECCVDLSHVESCVSAYKSEVLGSQANAWMESGLMLVGGTKKRLKGKARTKQKRHLGPMRMNGTLGVAPRVNGIRLNTRFIQVANNATVLNPFTYAYLNLTNPQLSNGGSATAVSFFLAYAAMYRKFRDRGYRVRTSYGNNEGFFDVPFNTPFNYLPPNTIASNNAAFINIQTRDKLASAKGGQDRSFLKFRGSVTSMAGFASNNTEDAYVGLTDGSSPPSDNIYTLVSTATNGLASIAGILIVVDIQFTIDFIEHQTPAGLKRVGYTRELWDERARVLQTIDDAERLLKIPETESEKRLSKMQHDQRMIPIVLFDAKIKEAVGAYLSFDEVILCKGSGCPRGDPPSEKSHDNRADFVALCRCTEKAQTNTNKDYVCADLEDDEALFRLKLNCRPPTTVR